MKSGQYSFYISGNCKAMVVDNEIRLVIDGADREDLREVKNAINGCDVEFAVYNRIDIKSLEDSVIGEFQKKWDEKLVEGK